MGFRNAKGVIKTPNKDAAPKKKVETPKASPIKKTASPKKKKAVKKTTKKVVVEVPVEEVVASDDLDIVVDVDGE